MKRTVGSRSKVKMEEPDEGHHEPINNRVRPKEVGLAPCVTRRMVGRDPQRERKKGLRGRADKDSKLRKRNGVGSVDYRSRPTKSRNLKRSRGREIKTTARKR